MIEEGPVQKSYYLSILAWITTGSWTSPIVNSKKFRFEYKIELLLNTWLQLCCLHTICNLIKITYRVNDQSGIEKRSEILELRTSTRTWTRIKP